MDELGIAVGRRQRAEDRIPPGRGAGEDHELPTIWKLGGDDIPLIDPSNDEPRRHPGSEIVEFTEGQLDVVGAVDHCDRVWFLRSSEPQPLVE